jgi:hypothetical protein
MENQKMSSNLEEVGKILRTLDYSLFAFRDENRDISISNVKKIKQSLSRKNVFGSSAVLVKWEDGPKGWKFYIYEGQHRFISSKELNQPIDFIINQNLEPSDIPLMNTAGETWILRNHLKHFLSPVGRTSSYDSYERLKNLLDKYMKTQSSDDSVRGLTFEDILFISTGWTSKTTSMFKSGNLLITEKQYEDADKDCGILIKFLGEHSVPENVRLRKYVRALYSMRRKIEGWKDSNYDTLLVDVISNRNMLNHKSYGKEEMYFDILLDIYNIDENKSELIQCTTLGKNISYKMVAVETKQKRKRNPQTMMA